jgi:hypothetical protein
MPAEQCELVSRSPRSMEIMKFYRWLFFLFCLSGYALAQPGAEVQAPQDESAQREQRRAELRNVLQTQHQAPVAGEDKRQLSPQEREELRQQLRQQPAVSPKGQRH